MNLAFGGIMVSALRYFAQVLQLNLIRLAHTISLIYLFIMAVTTVWWHTSFKYFLSSFSVEVVDT